MAKRKAGKGKSPKKSKNVTSGTAQGSSKADNPLTKEEIAQKILRIIHESQMTARSHPKLLDELKQLYYNDKTVDPNETPPSLHETTCASNIWNYILPFFNSEKGERADNALKFLVQIAKTVGVDNDTQQGHKPTPLYQIFVRFIIRSHDDWRPLIRQRQLELAYIILQTFSEVNEFGTLKGKLLSVFRPRAKDKVAAIRLQAIECLTYYKYDREARQVLTFGARKDTNAEVRRKALNILGDLPSIKISVFYEQAFDANENIRLAAFKSLVKIPLSRITGVQQRGKIITWGLMDPSPNVRAVVKKELLPAWLVYSNNSLATLFTKLELYTRPRIARQILDNFYNDGEEDFLKIDLGFLSPEKVVPLKEISIEKHQYWLMLCEKFGDSNTCRQKLLPEALPMCEYILGIVELIHQENQNAKRERRSEDYTRCLCLTAVLRIAKMIGLEEGSRREMQKVVQQILADPVLGDSIITNAAMNIAHDVFLKEEWEEYMSHLFDTLFVVDGGVVLLETPRNQSRVIPIRCETENIDPTSGLKKQSSDKNTPVITNNVSVTPVQNPAKNSRPSLRPTYASTPTLRIEESKAVYNLDRLRNMVTEKRLQRLRAQDARERFIEENKNSMNLTIIRKQLDDAVDQLKAEELELMDKCEAAKHADDIGFITEEGTAAPIPILTNSFRVDTSRPLTPIHSIHHDSDSDNEEMEVTHEQERLDLKGLGILVRYLSLHRKINDQICHILENIVISGLEDENPRIRAKAMNVLCVAAIVEQKRARSTMLLLYTGVVMEPDLAAQVAAFTSLLDLLLEYGPDNFRQIHEESSSELPSDCRKDLPHADVFNDPEATSEQLKDALTSIVVNFNSDPPTPKALEIRIIGITKLFLRGRLTSENVLADLLCTWADPTSHRSPISMIGYQINAFLPAYASLELENSNRVGKALIIALRRIVEEMEEMGKTVKDSEYFNLIDFVLPCISAPAIEKFPNYHTVHEKLAVAILEDIDKEIVKKGNAQLARILHHLNFKSDEGIIAIRNGCEKVLETIVDNVTANGATSLRTAIHHTLRRLETDVSLSEEENEAEADE